LGIGDIARFVTEEGWKLTPVLLGGVLGSMLISLLLPGMLRPPAIALVMLPWPLLAALAICLILSIRSTLANDPPSAAIMDMGGWLIYWSRPVLSWVSLVLLCAIRFAIRIEEATPTR
jgi:hypothetical protein